MTWQDEIQWELQYMKGKGCTTQVYRMTLSTAIYSIWFE